MHNTRILCRCSAYKYQAIRSSRMRSFCAPQFQRGMSLLLLAAAGGGALLIPLLLLRFYQLPKIPQGRVDAFLEKARRGPIAHRGGIPENTLSAFRLSKTGGASGIEVDLVFSKDSHPVLLHDDTVDRTSNGHGRVDELTFEQLRVLDFGGKFG